MAGRAIQTRVQNEINYDTKLTHSNSDIYVDTEIKVCLQTYERGRN